MNRKRSSSGIPRGRQQRQEGTCSLLALIFLSKDCIWAWLLLEDLLLISMYYFLYFSLLLNFSGERLSLKWERLTLILIFLFYILSYFAFMKFSLVLLASVLSDRLLAALTVERTLERLSELRRSFRLLSLSTIFSF